MDTVEMKAFHMMENREDVAVARATAGMIMMANSKEGGQSETCLLYTSPSPRD